ncbi:vesicular glutamate transporter 3-like isoform X1 [Branchiostoma floridae]|uniref:Vesicular glutamate transporter 3-like isoform X1 n=1 Tax=Branchiostoma floridae TaxID=7739 RepID=A0A9J7KZR4_BRAFL|nr:vesicular glutamate transporter 3-like isoform X1 [Branchiostoma floridae]
MVGVLFGCYYWGYVATKLIGGYLFDRYSSVRILEGCIFLGAVIHIAQPPAARLHVSAFIISLIMQGLVESMTIPAAYAVMGAWVIRTENNQGTPFTLLGITNCQYIGMFLGACATGAITEKLGWAASFYIFGMVGIAWGVIADVSIRDLSLERPPKDQEDANFLQDSQDGHSSNQGAASSQTQTTLRPPIPWTRMLTSPAVHVIMLCQASLQCASHLMTTYAPLYYVHSFHRDVKTIGTSTGVSGLIVAGVLSVAGSMAGSCYKYKRSNRSTVRVNTIGFFGLAGSYILLAVCTNFSRSLLSFFLAGVFAATAMCGGFALSPLDIAPNFAAEIKGISTAVSHLVGSIFVVVVGLMTKCKTRNEWSLVFTVTACALVVAAILFIIFGSGEEQSWARDESHEKILTCTTPAGPHVKAIFTRTILPVQHPLEEDYMDNLRHSDEGEEEYLEEDTIATANLLADRK